jgi:hypothetical protein
VHFVHNDLPLPGVSGEQMRGRRWLRGKLREDIDLSKPLSQRPLFSALRGTTSCALNRA